MQLSDIRIEEAAPLRSLLAGHMSAAQLSRVCSAVRNTPAGAPPNGVIGEQLAGAIGKAAMLKSKAATAIPAELRGHPDIAKMLEVAGKMDAPVTDPSMEKWVAKLAKLVGTKFKVDPAAIAKIAIPKAKAEAEKAAAELKAAQDEDGQEGGKAAELAKLKKDLAHKKALADIRRQHGAPDDSPEAAAKKAARAKTLAKVMGLDPEGLDPDTLEELVKDDGAGGGGKKRGGLMRKLSRIAAMRKKMEGRLAKKAATVPKESAQLLLAGIAKMISEDQGGSIWDSLKSLGSQAMSGLSSLFGYGKQEEMGEEAMQMALKSYIAARMVAAMAGAVETVKAQGHLDRPEEKVDDFDPSLTKNTKTEPMMKMGDPGATDNGLEDDEDINWAEKAVDKAYGKKKAKPAKAAPKARPGAGRQASKQFGMPVKP